MDKINPKDCQVLSLSDSGFLQFFRVVSSDYGKTRRTFTKTTYGTDSTGVAVVFWWKDGSVANLETEAQK